MLGSSFNSIEWIHGENDVYVEAVDIEELSIPLNGFTIYFHFSHPGIFFVSFQFH